MLDPDQDQHSINPVPQHWVEHFIVNVRDASEFLPVLLKSVNYPRLDSEGICGI
jgi:hypothetical protein